MAILHRQEITFHEALNHEHEYALGVDKMTGLSPLMPYPNGRYPNRSPAKSRTANIQKLRSDLAYIGAAPSSDLLT